MKIYVGLSRTIDFQNELYLPLRRSKLNELFEITLPHEFSYLALNSKENIKDYDVILAEVSNPSLGLGIELGWADAYQIPIITLTKPGCKVSQSVALIASRALEYSTLEEVVGPLKDYILTLSMRDSHDKLR